MAFRLDVMAFRPDVMAFRPDVMAFRLDVSAFFHDVSVCHIDVSGSGPPAGGQGRHLMISNGGVEKRVIHHFGKGGLAGEKNDGAVVAENKGVGGGIRVDKEKNNY